MKSLWKVTKTVLIFLFCIEIFLHFYNPILQKENVNSISDYSQFELSDLLASGLDSNLKHTTNSLGFRGKEPDKQFKGSKIICMGGSATACFYLNDGKDWPNILGKKIQDNKPDIWMNNAGLTDKSVVDNLKLLKKHILKLKPDYIYLMCGLDDIGNVPRQNNLIEKSRIKDFYNFLELPKTILSIFKTGHNQVKNNFELLDLEQAEKLEMSDTQVLQRIAQEQPLINNYKKSLQEFADLCKMNQIQLILVSQVILFGDEKDLLSDVNLGNIKIGTINGRTEALLLKQYNKSTYDIAITNQLTFINLSARLPKDSRFFYDGFHFTNDGAEMVATIIFDESKDLIKK